jgi:hypothetical protein
MKNGYQILIGEPEGKRSLRRPRQEWEGNIKMVLNEIGYTEFNWPRIGCSGELL